MTKRCSTMWLLKYILCILKQIHGFDQAYSLHSSIIEGAKPEGGRQQVHWDHHLSILFKGFLEPLEQADGLVLQWVHLCRIRITFPSLDILRWRCSAGLGSILWGLVFQLMFCSAGGRCWEPPRVTRQWQAECTAPHHHGAFRDGSGDRDWADRCHPPQSPLSQDTSDYHPARLLVVLRRAAVTFNHKLQEKKNTM